MYSGLYYRSVCDIRGRNYNSVAGGIIVQICSSEIIHAEIKVHLHIYLCTRYIIDIYHGRIQDIKLGGCT
jgi:hypothetical protein